MRLKLLMFQQSNATKVELVLFGFVFQVAASCRLHSKCIVHDSVACVLQKLISIVGFGSIGTAITIGTYCLWPL